MGIKRKKDQIAVEHRKSYFPDFGEKKERNEGLVRDYLAGFSEVDLIKKYSISATRLHQILEMYRQRPQPNPP